MYPLYYLYIISSWLIARYVHHGNADEGKLSTGKQDYSLSQHVFVWESLHMCKRRYTWDNTHTMCHDWRLPLVADLVI